MNKYLYLKIKQKKIDKLRNKIPKQRKRFLLVIESQVPPMVSLNPTTSSDSGYKVIKEFMLIECALKENENHCDNNWTKNKWQIPKQSK